MGTQRSWSRVWTGGSCCNPWGVMEGVPSAPLISEVGPGGVHGADEGPGTSAPHDATRTQPATGESARGDSA